MRRLTLLLILVGSLLGVLVDSVVAFAQTLTEKPATSENASDPAGKGVAGDASDEAAEQQEKQKYLRIAKDDAGDAVALQTSIVRFVGQPGTKHDGAIVDLVGVVHIGEKAYYKDLNKRLSKYDSVLYELVAPDGTRISPEDLKKRRSIIASMQSGMKDALELEYQLELIDYMASNFRHADMSPEEFSKDLKRRGDSVWKMVARMMGASIAAQSKTGGDMGMLMAMFSNDRSTAMKNAMARQLIEMESLTAGINDANGENTLIKGRNAKAFKVLKEELGDGKEKLAVFYGAGHLADMAERLESDFGMKPVKSTWLNAWDLSGEN
jgi:hypothetical protein